MRRLVILIAGMLIVPAVLTAQFDQVWVSGYNGQYDPSHEGGRRVTVGADGYVYACGQGLGASPYRDDFITLKLDPATGETLWVRYFGGLNPRSISDSVRAIAVDNAGGVYVTGSSRGSNNLDDYVTIKYSASDGRQCWVARYNYDGGIDKPAAIAVDNSGGVYVTGYSHIYGTNQHDYATVKYNASDGSECWVARYGYNGWDNQPAAIAADNSGGIYVTGSSSPNGWSNTNDYATVRYNASDGSESWVSRYNGTGNSADYATAIAVDNSGGVYVTGRSWGYYFDFATIKYTASDGSESWVARYNGPTNGNDYAQALALDNSGGVYVTGYSHSYGYYYDFATIKYTASDGSESWVARYNGPGNLDDRAYSVAADNAGGVYVTGSSVGSGTGNDYATIRYNASDGSKSWVARYSGYDYGAESDDRAYSVAVDNAGGVYVTGGARGATRTKDFVTVRYAASDGGQAWAASWNLSRSSDYGTKVVCDADGYVYVCGHGNNPSYSNDDFITIKYDPATGETLWVRYYDGPPNSNDRASAIAVDNAGGVYVTGHSYVSGGIYDFVTVKYNAADGSQCWMASYNGPGNSTDAATAIAVDNAGGVYVTGASTGSGTQHDYATIKYNAANGSQIWLARYNGPANDYDRPYDIALDNSGGVYVTGYSVGIGTRPDYLTVRYSAADGSESWFARYNGPGNADDYVQAIAVDNSGGVYVTGYSYDDATGNDYVTIKYNASDGSQSWLVRYDGPASEHDQAYGIAADNAGGVYVTGYSYATNSDYATIKYNASDGSSSWVARYNGPANGNDGARAIALDASGVYVTGYSYASGTDCDYATVWYDLSDGNELGSARHEGWGEDFAYSVATGPLGTVYVTGYTRNITDDILTVKYRAVVSMPNPWGGSTLAQGYWKNHPYYDRKQPDAPYIEKYLPVTVAGVTVNTVPEALAVFNPPKPITAWKRFLMQLLAARLNACWQTDPGLLAAWYNYPGGDYPFDNQQVSTIFQVADGYRPTTDGAVLTEMATVLGNINEYTDSQNRCLWDGQFPPGSGPQGAGVTALAPRLDLSVAPSLVKSGIVRIAYSLPKAGPAQLKVLDILGRTILTRELPANSRTGSLSIDLGDINAGVFIVRVTCADLTASRKLVVQR